MVYDVLYAINPASYLGGLLINRALIMPQHLINFNSLDRQLLSLEVKHFRTHTLHNVAYVFLFFSLQAAY